MVTLDVDADERSARASFAFDQAQAFFAGHFPGNPMVPGVFLIEITRILSERVAGRALDLVEVLDARFTSQVRPNDTILATVKLTSPDEAAGALRCDATLATRERSAGRVRLALEHHAQP